MNGTRRETLAALAGGAAALAGCMDALGESESASEFRIETLAFASVQPTGYDEYEPQPDATFERGETVWFYIGVLDPTPRRATVELDAAFTISMPDGELIEAADSVAVDTQGRELDGMVVTNGFFTSTEFPTGTYELTVDLTDTNSGETAVVTGEFILT